MILERRDFLRMLGVAAGATSLGACGRLWSVPDELVELALRGPGLESEVQTVCGLCESGCGLSVRLVDGLPVGLKGNPQHPLNRGGLCPVGHAGLEILYAPDRLTGPMRRGPEGALQPISWEAALSEISERIGTLLGGGQADRIALLSGDTSQVFTDLAERFVLALGSPNMASLPHDATAGYLLTQGIPEIPAYDLTNSDLVITFGLDLFEDGPAPIHAVSALVGSRSDDLLADLLYVGTRVSPTATKASQRLMVRPGTEGAFALGIAHVLAREGGYDEGFIQQHTRGFEDLTDEQGRQWMGFRRLVIERYYPDRVAQVCGCEAEEVILAARRLADASRPVAVCGGAATQGSNATFNTMAVHSLNALLGAFGRPGGVLRSGPVPLAPMPALPGGTPARSASIFAGGAGGALPGSHPVEALADGVLSGDHPVEILILVGGNPAYAAGSRGRLLEALERIPMVVALTSFADETAAAADLVLPASTFLEGWQCTTNPATAATASLGIGRPVLPPLHDTRHPADVLIDLGRRTAPDPDTSFPWEDYEAYLRTRIDGLAASRQGVVIKGAFEESWVRFLADRGWRFTGEQGREEFWEDLTRHGGWWDPSPIYGDWGRLFRTPSGRFEFLSTTLVALLRELGRAEGGPSGDQELLRRGRDRLQLSVELDEVCLPHYEAPIQVGEGEVLLAPFHPITSRGTVGTASPMVAEMFGYAVLSGWETWAEMAPETAHELDLKDGDIVELGSEASRIPAVVRIRHGSSPGVVHVPVGLGHPRGFGSGEQIGSNPMDLLLAARDPLSGFPATGATRVQVRLERRRPHGAPAPVEGGHVR